MPSKPIRPGAAKGKKGPNVGTGGHGRKKLEGKGPTPKAEDRKGHKAFRAKKIASVPFAHPIAYLDPQYLAKFFSKSITALPFINELLLIIFLISVIIFSDIFLSCL
jgi:23S rRNA (guanosine2251-2'-O)-methyltransferase